MILEKRNLSDPQVMIDFLSAFASLSLAQWLWKLLVKPLKQLLER